MWVYLRVDEPLPYLCFTANEANSTLILNSYWSPTAVSLETSTDWTNWSTYTFWDTITLSNIWDKVYWRNTSETTTWFSSGMSNYYSFTMTWGIDASWDVTSLINKNCTDTITWTYCFYALFVGCTSLRTTPLLQPTTLTSNCYYYMFNWCSNLVEIPNLPAITLQWECYKYMFTGCSKIKLSTTQTWEYQTAYRIPTEWTWTEWYNSLADMFTSTWWTFTWTPSINTTYYTSNTVV